MDIERPAQVTLEDLKQEAIVQSEGIYTEFTIGRFLLTPDSDTALAVAIIACVGQKILVAFPEECWSRRTDKRKLPSGSFERPVLLGVAGCIAEDRETPIVGCTINLWVGWLKKSFWKQINFDSDIGFEADFVDRESADPCFPSAAALAAAAQEKFQVSQDPNPGIEDRFALLEAQFLSLQSGLNEVLAAQRGESFITPAEESGSAAGGGFLQPTAKPSAGRKSALKKPPRKEAPSVSAPPGLEKLEGFPGIDPGAASAALQAGIPEAHLRIMSQALSGKPQKLEDYPRGADAAGPASSDSDVLDAAEETGDGDATSSDAVGQALLKLTHIVSKLTKKKVDSLEETLDNAGGSGLGDVSSSLGKKHAAARNALKKTFQDSPEKIWQSVESRMAEDFGMMSVLPNSGTQAFSARAWTEHRSKIQGYPRAVRWVWGVAGILDALRENNVHQARARACLMLAQAEQESLDHGSFLLAQEFSMEAAPPISSFSRHVIPDPTEMATTSLLDPRWVEAYADRLKQVDNYMEVRKKLNARSTAPAPGPLKTKGKKGDGKGKGADRTEDT